jgi:O-antigen/teichoic acid export membrane protein
VIGRVSIALRSGGLVNRLADSGLVSRFARGAGWSMAAMGFTVAANFLGSILFARILGQKSYGAYGIVQTTMMTTVALSSQFGNAAVNRYVAEFRWTQKERAGRIIGLNVLGTTIISITLGCILAILSPFLARDLFHAPALLPALIIAAATVPLMNINGVNMAALAGFEVFRACARITLIGGIAYLATGAIGAMLWGVPGALLGWLGGLGVQLTISRRSLKTAAAANDVPVQYRGSWVESDSILRFNVPAMLAGLSPMLALWIGQILIVQRTDGFEDMALYSASYTLRSAVIVLPYVFYTVTMSVINSYHADRTQFRRVYWMNVIATMLVALAAAGFIAVFAPWILSIFGKDFRDGTPIVLILLCGAVLEATWVAVYQIIQARELIWTSFLLVTLPRDLSIAALAVYLVPHYGARGLAFAYAAGWMLALLVTIGIVMRAGVAPAAVAETSGAV